MSNLDRFLSSDYGLAVLWAIDAAARFEIGKATRIECEAAAEAAADVYDDVLMMPGLFSAAHGAARFPLMRSALTQALACLDILAEEAKAEAAREAREGR